MILMIDNYDSFTYNLVDYLGRLAEEPIEVVRNDRISIAEIEKMNPSAIIISPGPKAPKDAGVSKDVIAYFAGKIPILGVCLGHQAIGEVFGCDVVRARNLMHGKTSNVVHRGSELFEGVPNPFVATRYHSLVIDPHSLSEEIEPIAFAVDDGEIMAVRHRVHAVYGVQFHPESVCTPEGMSLIENFLKLSRSFRKGSSL